uniref:Serpin domain-containing protein n=1 Tax=Romanomermis culicivorax TaxID=13658 RepID=A0A915I4I7_ROMCU
MAHDLRESPQYDNNFAGLFYCSWCALNAEEHVFHSGSDRYFINNYVQSLLNASRDYTTEKATLKYATVLAIDKRFPVTERFTSITKKEFHDAKFFNAAFSWDGKKAEAYINHVVAETTEDRIKNLIPNGSLGAHTAMVL